MNKKVTIQGISRMLPSSVSTDGLCRDIIGMRLYNGALRPIGSHTAFQSSGVVAGSKMHIHTITTGDQYIIAYNSTTGVVNYCKTGSSAVATLTTLAVSKTVRFASLKNVLLIINETDETMAYAVFNTGTLVYDYIGTERFADILQIDFLSLEDGAKLEEATGDTVTAAGYTFAWANQQIESLLLPIETEKNKTGTFTGGVAFVYAWELFDGTIVKHSHPVYIKSGLWQYYLNDHVVGGDSVVTPMVKYHHYDVSYVVTDTNAKLNTIRATYSNIIKSVNIYMTRPVNTYNSDIETSGITVDTWYEVDDESEASIRKKVMDQPYFLVKKLSLEELVNNLSAVVYSSDISSISSLSPLPVDNFSHHSLYSSCDFAYNSRLFLGDIKTFLYKGYWPLHFVRRSSTYHHAYTTYYIYFEIELKDGAETKVVTSTAYAFDEYDGAGKITFALTPLISYPDSRASTLRVFVRDGITFYKAAEYALSKHPLHNFAYYVTSEGNHLDETTYVQQTMKAVDNIVIDNNRIQSTKVNNAFVFPAENSYDVGHNAVVGLGANSLMVDTGQFGEFPIYAFTESGVWALAISSDPSILIDRIVPATRDVCINKDSIVPTEAGVVFLSGDGVMIISGMQSEKLSLPLEGTYVSVLDDNPDFGYIKASAVTSDVSANMEDCSFSVFLSGAVMGYNYIKKELIISNPAKEYSYLYSFQSKSWYRQAVKYSRFISRFPAYLGERSGTLYNVTSEDYSAVTHIPVFIETSHIKLEADSFKKIIAMAGRGMFASKAGKNLGVYLFGSVDGVRWHMISGNEKPGNIQDVILPRSSWSIIYLAVVISGTLAESSYLTHLDFEFEKRFGSRIR
jgi:hypothetical protein